MFINQNRCMFAPLPQSVVDQSWEAWEGKCMQKEDVDAAVALTHAVEADASDSELSCVSEADSSTSRRHKLSKPTCSMTLDQMGHLRAIKRHAQKRLYNVQRKGGNAKHLQGLVDDISAALGQCTTQTRGSGGKFGSATTHPM